MSRTPKRDWPMLIRLLALFLVGSLFLSGFVMFIVLPAWGSDIVRLFLILVVMLWGVGALFAARHFRISEIAAVAVGLTSGPLFCLLYIYIVQGHVWVWYPFMFILIPALATLTWLPIAFVARWRSERGRQHAA